MAGIKEKKVAREEPSFFLRRSTFNYSAENCLGRPYRVGKIFFENCELTQIMSQVFFEMNLYVSVSQHLVLQLEVREDQDKSD